MRKIWMAVALVASCSGVWANELADADKLVEQGNYARAIQIFSRLAEAGDGVAQQKLGEMYWYGEAGPIDGVKAQFWLKKASAQGNQSARALLAVMDLREQRKKEIDFYTTHFDGGAAQFSKSGCVRPMIPAVSEINKEIKRVNEEQKAWTECYTRFIADIQKLMPADKTIPADLLDIMNADDITQSRQTVDKVYSAIVADVVRQVEQVDQQYGSWRNATVAFVNATNDARLKDHLFQAARSVGAISERPVGPKSTEGSKR